MGLHSALQLTKMEKICFHRGETVRHFLSSHPQHFTLFSFSKGENLMAGIQWIMLARGSLGRSLDIEGHWR